MSFPAGVECGHSSISLCIAAIQSEATSANLTKVHAKEHRETKPDTVT